MNYTSSQNMLLLIGRMLTSVLFIVSGYNKFARYDFYVGFFGKLGIPSPDLAVYAVGAFEIAAAAALILGLRTRQTAIALGVYSIAAAALAHTAFNDMNQLTHFLKNLSILGALLAFGVSGAGAYSLDARAERTSDAMESDEAVTG